VAGVDPVYGLYAGSVTVLVGSLFASSTLLVVTATNALALVTRVPQLGSRIVHESEG
jgi:sulfate permease, SulP family